MTETITMTAEGGTQGTIMDRVAGALTSMEALRQAVERKVAELNGLGVEVLKGSDLASVQRDLGKALAQLMAEEGKVADALRIERGGDGICLDTARAEIGGALDRIASSLKED